MPYSHRVGGRHLSLHSDIEVKACSTIYGRFHRQIRTLYRNSTGYSSSDFNTVLQWVRASLTRWKIFVSLGIVGSFKNRADGISRRLNPVDILNSSHLVARPVLWLSLIPDC